MIQTEVPAFLLFLLRQLLFLAPLGLTVFLMLRARGKGRLALGALFSFLYGMPLVFLSHVWAIHLGLWHFGDNALKIMGFPADIWFGGTLLWGPVIFLAFPNLNPWIPALIIMTLCGILLPSFDPFMVMGPGWFAGIVAIFALTHLPSLYLARWTARDCNLPGRAFLLAMAYGPLVFFTLPSVIMRAMGGGWARLSEWPTGALVLFATALVACLIPGLTTAQAFALHGAGTPIPLDPTKRLVRTGIYAYIRNPMQASASLGWVLLGLALQNIWVALAAAMAVCFVQGIVRWHHRQDLEIRFPEGWAEYCAHVPEWWPRWRPWVRAPARLRVDRAVPWQRRLVGLLTVLGPVGLTVEDGAGAPLYLSPDELQSFGGVLAFIKALEHVNLAGAFLAAALFLLVLPVQAFLRLRLFPGEARNA